MPPIKPNPAMMRTAKKAAGINAARTAQQEQHLQDLAGSVQDVSAMMSGGGSVGSGNSFMAAVQAIDTVANPLMMGFDMAMPAAIGAVGVAGKSTQWVGSKMGAENLGASVAAVPEKVEAVLDKRMLGETRWGEAYAKTVSAISRPFEAGLRGLGNATGLLPRRVEQHLNNAAKHAEKAAGHARELTAHLSPEAAAHVSNMMNSAAAGDALELMTHQGELTKLGHRMAAPAEKSLEKLGKALKKQAESVASHRTLSHISNGSHNTLESVRHTSVREGVSKGLWSVGTVTSGALAVRDTMSDMDAFRSLVADIKGVDKEAVTSGDALFGELPLVGQEARKALLKSAAPRAVLQAVSQTFNMRMLMGKHVNLGLMIGVPLLGDQAVAMFNNGNLLDVYKEMKQNEDAGIANDAEHYAQLIGAAHKELHQRGGDESSFTQEVGRLYAEKHASLHETLADAQNGKITQLLEHIKHHNAATQAIPTDQQLAHVGEVTKDLTDEQGAHIIAGDAVPSPTLGSVQSIAANSNVPQRSAIETIESQATANAAPPARFVDKVAPGAMVPSLEAGR